MFVAWGGRCSFIVTCTAVSLRPVSDQSALEDCVAVEIQLFVSSSSFLAVAKTSPEACCSPVRYLVILIYKIRLIVILIYLNELRFYIRGCSLPRSNSLPFFKK